MAPKKKKVCIKCKATESPQWTNAENLGAVCLECVNETKDSMKSYEVREKREALSDTSRNVKDENKKRKTKYFRLTRKHPLVLVRSTVLRSKHSRNRRTVAFKSKKPLKSSSNVACTHTTEATWYKSQYFQIGDIVSLQNKYEVYYAQIRGLVCDKFMEKSAALRWLVPSKESPPPNVCFDPKTYAAGPEEDLLRRLSCMKFVLHFDEHYYVNKKTPYSRIDAYAEPGYIWTILYPIYYNPDDSFQHTVLHRHSQSKDNSFQSVIEPAILGSDQNQLKEKTVDSMSPLELFEYFTNSIHEEANFKEDKNIHENSVEIIDLTDEKPLDLSKGHKLNKSGNVKDAEQALEDKNHFAQRFKYSPNLVPGVNEPIAHCSKTDQPYYDPEKNTMIVKPYMGDDPASDDSDSD